MITDANGMPVLQPLVDDASTATFNAAFAQIGTVVAAIPTPAIRTYKWANAAARTAQTGMTDGDLGVELDTDLFYKYNGTAWVVLTGSTSGTVSLSSGTTGSGRVSRDPSTGIVTVLFDVSRGSALSDGTVVANIATADLRPTGTIQRPGAASVGGAAGACFVQILANGNISIYGAGANSQAGSSLQFYRA